jgi:toxin ParE1/3/4
MPAAENDLENIWHYTADNWSPVQADRYADALEAVFKLLVSMPGLARERQEFNPPVRIHPSASHVIVYRIEGDVLIVMRVLGAKQNWRALLEDSG